MMRFILLTTFLCFSLISHSQCIFSDLVAEASLCDASEEFMVDVDFNFVGTTDSFEIRGNGNSYGIFAYENLPVTIGPFAGDCSTEYEIIVLDQMLPECNADTNLGIICCGNTCNLSELTAVPLCINMTTAIITLDLVHQGSGTQFSLMGNGNVYGIFEYSTLPIEVMIEADCVTAIEFIAMDTENPECSVVIDIGAVCCVEECSLSNLTVTIEDCDIENQFNVSLDFNIDSPESTQFIVTGNGSNYGSYSYEDLPVEIFGLNGDCLTEYEFVVTDAINEDCFTTAEVGVVCCSDDCAISEMTVDISECNEEGLFFTIINFDFTDPTSDAFQVVGNGVNYGTFLYTDLPIIIHSLEGDCSTEYEFIVFDSQNEGCKAELEVGKICCTDCVIEGLIVEAECQNDTSFTAVINFEHEGTSDSFDLQINGVLFGSFGYDILPLFIEDLTTDCEEEFVFSIFDDANDGCFAQYELGSVCCGMECSFGEVIAETTACSDQETFFVQLDLIDAQVESFQVAINGDIIDQLTLEDLPATLGPFEGDCETVYILSLFTNTPAPGCEENLEIGPVCCLDCEIGEMVAEWECINEELFNLTFNIEITTATSDSFRLEGNGNQYGTFAYANLPITIFELDVDCDLEYEFIAIDQENEDCSTFIGFEQICCEEDCQIGEMIGDWVCINEELFNIMIDIEVLVGTSDSFRMAGNGNQYGTFAYSDLPITLFELEVDCELEYEFVAIDQENEACSTFINMEKICCTEVCEIDITGVLNPECVDGLANFEIEFEATTPSEPLGFDVFLNGQYILTNPSTNIEIIGYEDEKAEILITICYAAGSEDCCDSFTFMNPCFIDAINEDKLAGFLWRSDGISAFTENTSSYPIDFQIYTLDGQAMMFGTLQSMEKSTIEFNDYATGVYLVKAIQNKKSIVQKFIIVR